MKTLPPLWEHVRLHPDMYLFGSTGLSIVERLILGLMSDAMYQNSASIHIFKRESSVLICSERNWLQSASHSESELFHRLVPLNNAMQNSVRHEAIVAAFSSDVLLVGAQEKLIKGTVEAFDLNWLKNKLTLCDSCFGIAFIV
jgi:hypothetical protein